MKTKTWTLGFAFMIVLIFVYLLYFSNSITGNIIEYANENISKTSSNISFQDALIAINESEIIIQQMAASNFSTVYVNDLLIEAKKRYDLVYNADILRGNVEATLAQKTSAKETLKFVSWKNLDFDYVLEITNNISERLKWAYDLSDSIMLVQNRIDFYSKNGLKVISAQEILNNAKISFNEDRYEEAENLIKQSQTQLEDLQFQASTLASYRDAFLNFFQKYWIVLLILLVIFSIGGYYGGKRLRVYLIKEKIMKMKTQREVLTSLMKEEQEKRYVSNKTPELIYNIRIAKYRERLNYLKAQIPVLETRLRKFNL